VFARQKKERDLLLKEAIHEKKVLMFFLLISSKDIWGICLDII